MPAFQTIQTLAHIRRELTRIYGTWPGLRDTKQVFDVVREANPNDNEIEIATEVVLIFVVGAGPEALGTHDVRAN